MPCPVVCIGIIIWQSYKSRNLVSLSLLTIWRLTGLKAFFFNAYEDIILFGMGLLALGILGNMVRFFSVMSAKSAQVDSFVPDASKCTTDSRHG